MPEVSTQTRAIDFPDIANAWVTILREWDKYRHYNVVCSKCGCTYRVFAWSLHDKTCKKKTERFITSKINNSHIL